MSTDQRDTSAEARDPKPGSRDDQSQGLKAAFTSDSMSLSKAIGGPRGIVESVVPTLVFLVLFMITRDVVVSAGAALGLVALAILVRLVQRQQVGPAIGGALSVGIGALLAMRSGDGSDFYLPGLLTNGAYGLGLLVCVLANVPVIGYLAGMVDSRVADWKAVPSAVATYRKATLVYALFFLLKVAVQAPLYLAGMVDALGVAKLALGLPAFALVTWFIFLMHRRVVAHMATRPAND